MNIRFCNFYGDKREVDKTSYFPTVPLTISGTMRFPLDYLKPSIDIDFSALTSSQLTDFQNSNYCYIPQLQRYYYIVNKTFINDKICMITLVVDALTSNKDDIKSSTQYVDRSYSDGDELIEDTALPLALDKGVTEYDIENTLDDSEVNTTFHGVFSSAYKTYVLTIGNPAGWYNSNIAVHGSLPEIDPARFKNATGSICFALTNIELVKLATDLVKYNSTLSTFFKSIVAFPFALSEADATLQSIGIAKYDPSTNEYTNFTTQAQGYYIPCMSKRKIIADFVLADATSYLELKPYGHIEIFIPFYGWKEIDYNALQGHRIQIIYGIDYTNGDAVMSLYDRTNESVIFSSNVKVGLELPINSTNMEELMNQKEAMQNNLILSIVGSGVGLAGSILSHNVIGAVGSGLSMVKAVEGYNNQSSLMYEKMQSTSGGALGSIYLPLTPRIRKTVTKYEDGYAVDDFIKANGRACRKSFTLSSLSGMTIISNPILYGFGCMQSEKDEIRKAMQTGIIL